MLRLCLSIVYPTYRPSSSCLCIYLILKWVKSFIAEIWSLAFFQNTFVPSLLPCYGIAMEPSDRDYLASSQKMTMKRWDGFLFLISFFIRQSLNADKIIDTSLQGSLRVRLFFLLHVSVSFRLTVRGQWQFDVIHSSFPTTPPPHTCHKEGGEGLFLCLVSVFYC